MNPETRTDTAAVAAPTGDAEASTESQRAVTEAAAALRAANVIHVFYTSTGLDDITASVYSSDIVAFPRSASGDASLLIDGDRVHTSFEVTDGILWIGMLDGGKTDLGPAAGKFDPTVLLSATTGLASLLSRAQNPTPTGPGGAITAAIPAAAAVSLLPPEVLAAHETIPAELTIIDGKLNQLMLRVDNATASVTILSYDAPKSSPNI